MSYRSRTRKKTDNRVFRNTAMRTKKINLNPKISRGGIQL